MRLRLTLIALSLLAGCATLPQDRPPPAKQGQGLVLAGARGVPDLARGREAAAAGRLEDAERDLKPLAERGYTLAQATLARLYAQAGDSRAAEAQEWFRRVLPRVPTADLPLARLLIRSPDRARWAEARDLLRGAWQQRQDVEALTGLIDFYRLHPELDTAKEAEALGAQASVLQQPEARAAVIRWYRSTRETPGHAERLLKLCEESLAQVPECYVELARQRRGEALREPRQHLVQQAVKQFQAQQLDAPTLADLARALVEEEKSVESADMPAETSTGVSPRAGATARSCGLDPVAASAEPAAPKQAAAHADPALAAQLLQTLGKGDAVARSEAAAVVVRYPYLLPDLDAEAALKAGVAAQRPEAVLALAQLYIEGERAPRNPEAARELLQAAIKAPERAAQAHYLLGRLYQHGYLDEIDAPRALDHLVIAARSGYAPADAALARLFAAGRGLCPDPVSAAVFAAIGAQAGDPAMQRLQSQLQARMDPAQLRAANALYQQELAARGAASKSTAASADTGGRS